MMFVDYTFSLVGEHIMMDRELDPTIVKLKDGDRFIARVEEIEFHSKTLNQITFVKHPDDISKTPPEQD